MVLKERILPKLNDPFTESFVESFVASNLFVSFEWRAPNLNELNQKYERMSALGYLQTQNRFQYYLSPQIQTV